MGLEKDGAKKPGRGQGMAALGAGVELVVYALAGCLAGRWADGRFGTGPWLLLVGSLAGIGLGLFQFIRETSRTRT
jgi:F0F1-type ATP synthase assembly protein I